MTQPTNNWEAPLAKDLVSTELSMIKQDIKDTGKVSRRLLVGGALAGSLLIAAVSCGGDDDAAVENTPVVEDVQAEVDVTETPEYEALEAKYEDVEAKLTKLEAKYAELTAEESEDSPYAGDVVTSRIDPTHVEADVTDESDDTEESDDSAEADSEVTLEEQIKSNISKMSDKELLETYAFFDNPQWSENAREVGLMREVSHEQMMELIRHDRDVLGQIAGCFNYVENNEVKVNNLGEVCAGPEMSQDVEDAMNEEIQRLLDADLEEVAFTAEMVIAKLHGGKLTADVENLYKLTQYSGTYNTTRLENREDTIEGSTNTRYNDTWITFDSVTLENGEKYEMSFRACGQIVIPVDTPEPPVTPPTPPVEPPTEPPVEPPVEPPTEPPVEPKVDDGILPGPEPADQDPGTPDDPGEGPAGQPVNPDGTIDSEELPDPQVDAEPSEETDDQTDEVEEIEEEDADTTDAPDDMGDPVVVDDSEVVEEDGGVEDGEPINPSEEDPETGPLPVQP